MKNDVKRALRDAFNVPLFLALLCSILVNIALLAAFFFTYPQLFALLKKVGYQMGIVQDKPLSYAAHDEQRRFFNTMPKKAGDVVFLGDSHISLGLWSELFRRPDIQNRGISGDTTEGVLRRLGDIIEEQPSMIVMMVGINDMFWIRDKAKTLRNYQAILDRIRSELPEAKIVVNSVLPINSWKFWKSMDSRLIVELNETLAILAKQHNALYCDLFPAFVTEELELKPELTNDGLHLNGDGYVLWKSVLEAQVGIRAGNMVELR